MATSGITCGIRDLSGAAYAFAYRLLQRFAKVTIALVLAIFSLIAAPVLAQPVTVVALGDSLTAGYGLNEGEGLVPQLQAWLDGHDAQISVQNAGVSGDTTAGGLSRLDWALGEGAEALMVILGGNDMMRGIPVAEVEANLKAIMAKAKERGLPVFVAAMRAPSNWGADYKAGFDAIYPALGADVYLEDFFAGLLEQGASASDPASMARFMQGDGIHPNADGVREIVKALGPKLIDLAQVARQ